MPHPIHLCGQQLMVISRTMSTENQDTHSYAGLWNGFINSAGRDTVLVMPFEEVYSPAIPGQIRELYWSVLYHLENLEEEDLGMTRNFRVS
jgi:hypothetical protein